MTTSPDSIQEPAIASSNRCNDVGPYVRQLYKQDAETWGSIFPWEFPQCATKEEEESMIRRFFDDREVHMQGFRFLKQVWYSAAIYNFETRVPLVADWWLQSNQDLLNDPNMREHFFKSDVQPSTFFGPNELSMYRHKFLSVAIRCIQHKLNALSSQPPEESEANLDTSQPIANETISDKATTPVTSAVSMSGQPETHAAPATQENTSTASRRDSQKPTDLPAKQSDKLDKPKSPLGPSTVALFASDHQSTNSSRKVSGESQLSSERSNPYPPSRPRGSLRRDKRQSFNANHPIHRDPMHPSNRNATMTPAFLHGPAGAFMMQGQAHPFHAQARVPSGRAMPRPNEFVPMNPQGQHVPGSFNATAPDCPAYLQQETYHQPFMMDPMTSHVHTAQPPYVEPDVYWGMQPGNRMDIHDDQPAFNGEPRHLGRESEYAGHGRQRRESNASRGVTSRDNKGSFRSRNSKDRSSTGDSNSQYSNSYHFYGQKRHENFGPACQSDRRPTDRHLNNFYVENRRVLNHQWQPQNVGVMRHEPEPRIHHSGHRLKRSSHEEDPICGRYTIPPNCSDVTKVIVFQVSRHVPDRELAHFFSQFGQVCDVRRLPLKDESESTSNAFITFANADGARNCLEHNDIPWGNGYMRVAVPKEYWDPNSYHYRGSRRNLSSGFQHAPSFTNASVGDRGGPSTRILQRPVIASREVPPAVANSESEELKQPPGAGGGPPSACKASASKPSKPSEKMCIFGRNDAAERSPRDKLSESQKKATKVTQDKVSGTGPTNVSSTSSDFAAAITVPPKPVKLENAAIKCGGRSPSKKETNGREVAESEETVSKDLKGSDEYQHNKDSKLKLHTTLHNNGSDTDIVKMSELRTTSENKAIKDNDAVGPQAALYLHTGKIVLPVLDKERTDDPDLHALVAQEDGVTNIAQHTCAPEMLTVQESDRVERDVTLETRVSTTQPSPRALSPRIPAAVCVASTRSQQRDQNKGKSAPARSSPKPKGPAQTESLSQFAKSVKQKKTKGAKSKNSMRGKAKVKVNVDGDDESIDKTTREFGMAVESRKNPSTIVSHRASMKEVWAAKKHNGNDMAPKQRGQAGSSRSASPFPTDSGDRVLSSPQSSPSRRRRGLSIILSGIFGGAPCSLPGDPLKSDSPQCQTSRSISQATEGVSNTLDLSIPAQDTPTNVVISHRELQHGDDDDVNVADKMGAQAGCTEPAIAPELLVASGAVSSMRSGLGIFEFADVNTDAKGSKHISSIDVNRSNDSSPTIEGDSNVESALKTRGSEPASTTPSRPSASMRLGAPAKEIIKQLARGPTHLVEPPVRRAHHKRVASNRLCEASADPDESSSTEGKTPSEDGDGDTETKTPSEDANEEEGTPSSNDMSLAVSYFREADAIFIARLGFKFGEGESSTEEDEGDGENEKHEEMQDSEEVQKSREKLALLFEAESLRKKHARPQAEDVAACQHSEEQAEPGSEQEATDNHSSVGDFQ